MLGSLSVPGALQLLSYLGGEQFSSYVQRITAWRADQKPAWAN
jgi:hypothetical protein